MQMNHFRVARLTLYLITSLLGAIAALYVSSPLWVPAAVSLVLPANVQLVELMIERPTRRRIFALLAVLRIVDGKQQRLQIHIEDIVVDFTWASIMARRLAAVQIGDLSLTIPPQQPNRARPPGEALSLASLFPEVLLAKLPFTRLEITQLSLNKPGDAKFFPLEGHAELIDNVFTLTAASKNLNAWQAAIRADKHNKINLSVAKGQAPVVVIDAAVAEPANGGRMLIGTTQAHIVLLDELLHKLALTPEGMRFEGQLQSDWSLQLPVKLDELTLANVRLNGNVKGAIAAKLAKLGNVDCQRLVANDQASIAHFSVTGPQVDVVPQQLGCRGQLTASLVPDVIKLPTKDRLLNFTVRAAPQTILQLNLENLTSKLDNGEVTLNLGTTAAKGMKSLQLALQIREGRFALRQVSNNNTNSTSQLTQGFAGSGQLSFSGHAFIPTISTPPYSAKDVNFTSSGTARFNGTEVHLLIDKGGVITASDLHWLDGSTAKASIRSRNNTALDYLAKKKVTVGKADFVVATPGVSAFGRSFSYRDFTVRTSEFSAVLGAPTQLSGAVQLALGDLVIPVGELRSSPLQISMNMVASEQTLNGKLHIHSDGSALLNELRIDGTLTHNVTSNQGLAQMHMPALKFSEAQRFLPLVFQQWPYPLDLSAGTLRLDADLDWRGGPAKSTLQLYFDNIGGFYQRKLFNGLTGDVTAFFNNGVTQISGNTLKLTKFDPGFPIENISLQLQPLLNAIGVRQLKADVLGGHVTVKDMTYDWTKQDNHLTVDIEGVDLAQVLQLESGVSGSGIVDGRLPLTINEQGIAMNAGQLRARKPGGTIRYVGELSAGSLGGNPQLGMAIDVLKNFHYEVLDIESDYAENGRLKLSARLQGRNPDMAGSRPVNFNLNITEDIPALLKSLQLTQDISDKLEKRIRQLDLTQQ